ncbi:MAG TPA: TetR/AcrR family transcriptional regulator, partial [Nocardioides sp.]
GRLRQDFTHQDVPLILMANAGVVTATRNAAPDAWKRLVGFLIQAFAAEAAQPLPEPPTPRQMYRALMRLTD